MCEPTKLWSVMLFAYSETIHNINMWFLEGQLPIFLLACQLWTKDICHYHITYVDFVNSQMSSAWVFFFDTTSQFYATDFVIGFLHILFFFPNVIYWSNDCFLTSWKVRTNLRTVSIKHAQCVWTYRCVAVNLSWKKLVMVLSSFILAE